MIWEAQAIKTKKWTFYHGSKYLTGSRNTKHCKLWLLKNPGNIGFSMQFSSSIWPMNQLASYFLSFNVFGVNSIVINVTTTLYCPRVQNTGPCYPVFSMYQTVGTPSAVVQKPNAHFLHHILYTLPRCPRRPSFEPSILISPENLNVSVFPLMTIIKKIERRKRKKSRFSKDKRTPNVVSPLGPGWTNLT